jgi:N-acetyl sugar amidotransferase
MPREFRRCSVSVFDTLDDPSMEFDSEGRCNYYYDYQRTAAANLVLGTRGREELEKLAARIRREGKGKPYDCIIGLSGGVDSTYVAWLANELQFRPLAVHFDNGWNSEIAVSNIEKVVKKFGWDLHTLVVDWDEFRDLQRAYLQASVIDVEVPTDHAIAATLFRLAGKWKIPYVLSGSNVATEAVIPPHWIFNKLDHLNLLDIHRQFGTIPLKTYPLFDTVSKKRVIHIGGARSVSLLNLADYDYSRAKHTISTGLGWVDYGGKHHESIFTRFYQCEILPRKFGVDKRKAHLSNLIFSGQLTQSEALQRLEDPACTEQTLNSDRQFVLKKLGFTESQFNQLMSVPPRSHLDFDVERPLSQRYPMLRPLVPAFRVLRRIARLVDRK